MNTLCVLFLDHSLLVEGIAAYLTGRPELRIVRLASNAELLSGVVASLQPDFVIYEINTLRIEQLAMLLAECPRLQLVGVHLEHSGIVVLSGRAYRLGAMQDLIALLEESKPAAQAAVDVMNRAMWERGVSACAAIHDEVGSSQESMSGNYE